MKHAFLCLAAAVSFAAAADLKVGTVNMIHLVELHPTHESNKTLVKSSNDDYKAKLDAKQDALKALLDDARKIYEDMQNPMLSASAKADSQKKLDGMQQKVNAARQDLLRSEQNYRETMNDLETRLLKMETSDIRAKIDFFNNYSNFSEVPKDAMISLAKASVAIDQFIKDYSLDAIGLRCWNDLQLTAKISPCVLLSELNDRGIPAGCELDVCNAVGMLALHLASQEPATCLDWNNNYEDDPDKCILFHCGSIPQKLMAGKGLVVDHAMFKKALGPGFSFGCNTGFIRKMDFSFLSTMTENGTLRYYSGEGDFTGEPLGEGFFGCGGVAHIDDLQRKINRIGYAGYRHHVSVTSGHWDFAINEAFQRYLGYEKTEI